MIIIHQDPKNQSLDPDPLLRKGLYSSLIFDLILFFFMYLLVFKFFYFIEDISRKLY